MIVYVLCTCIDVHVHETKLYTCIIILMLENFDNTTQSYGLLANNCLKLN